MTVVAIYLVITFGLGGLAMAVRLPPLVGFLAAGFVINALDVPDVPQLEPLRGEDGRTTNVLTLSDRVCKWPIGDPNDQTFAFCGRGACSGPYCADHARLAYQPSQAKRRRASGEPDELRRMLRLSAM